MHLGHKQASRPQSVIEGIADPARRREIADQAADAASRIATEVAKRSADLSSQVGDRVSDVAQTVAEEGHELMEQHGKKLEKKAAAKAAKAAAVAQAAKAAKETKDKKPRKHRLRKALLLSGFGALGAYFLDPKLGAERRAAVMRRTSTSAQAVGDGLDKAARVAHQTADATTTGDPLKAAAESIDLS